MQPLPHNVLVGLPGRTGTGLDDAMRLVGDLPPEVVHSPKSEARRGWGHPPGFWSRRRHRGDARRAGGNSCCASEQIRPHQSLSQPTIPELALKDVAILRWKLFPLAHIRDRTAQRVSDLAELDPVGLDDLRRLHTSHYPQVKTRVKPKVKH